MPSPKGPPDSSRSPPVATAAIAPLTEPEPASKRETSVQLGPGKSPAPIVEASTSKAKTRLPAGPMVRLNRPLYSKLEVLFSSLAALAFIILELFIFISKCYVDESADALIKGFALLGAVVSIFVILNNSFEERAIIGRGAVGFFVFFLITGVVVINLLGAYWAMDCMCKCPRTANAFIAKTSQDLVIFILEISGSAFLLAILLVAAAV